MNEKSKISSTSLFTSYITICPKCKKTKIFTENNFNDSGLFNDCVCEVCRHTFIVTHPEYQNGSRLIKAMIYHRERINIEKRSLSSFLNFLFSLLKSRGMSGSECNKLEWEIIKTLEPPGCYMTHCKDYGYSSYFCNCVLEKVPGRCSVNRAYMKRVRERTEKMTEYLNRRCAMPDGTIVIPCKISGIHLRCKHEGDEGKTEYLPMSKLTIIEEEIQCQQK